MNFLQYLTEAPDSGNRGTASNVQSPTAPNRQTHMTGMAEPGRGLEQGQKKVTLGDNQRKSTLPSDKETKVGITDVKGKEGVVRKVKWAHLVHKKLEADGTYNELWVYEVGSKDRFRDELEIRKDILAGTDIPVNKTKSPDGSQHYELWSIGNVQMMNIKGLPQ